MGKVYLKTKYDNEMKMEIPHNHNFASAMFGFREMAAEIVPYHLIDDIYDDFKREDIALDYIDQCNVLFNKFGVTPHIPDYPDVLKPFLGRKIWKDTINSISRDENKWSAGYFVKPAVRSKAFTGKTISSIKDLMGCGNHAEDYAEMSIDTILIKMAQLNKRKSVLDQMRKQLPKAREEQRSYMSRNTVPEYRYINYDLELIKKEYEAVSKTIMEMQMALDKYNQTVQFEVDI